MKSEMLSWLKEHIAQTHISELKKEWLEIEKLNLDGPRLMVGRIRAHLHNLSRDKV